MKKKAGLLVAGFLLISVIVRPQETKTHDHSVTLNFLQIKEQLNYGLVFKGPGLGYSYRALWQNDKRTLAYEGRFVLSAPISRGVVAMAYDVVPVRFDYLFMTGNGKKVSVGPYAVAEYNYALYPDLQSGYSYWFTNFSVGCAVTARFNVKKSRIDLIFHTTAFGLTSRTEPYDDPYFFDLSFGDAVKFVHQDMQFGSWNLYNQSELELRWQPKPESRLAYGYVFQYYGYFDEPKLTMINQTIRFIILPKKNR